MIRNHEPRALRRFRNMREGCPGSPNDAIHY